MRARVRQWILVAGALLLGWAQDVVARVYLTREEAARLAFGSSVTISEETKTLTPDQWSAITRRLGRSVIQDRVTFDVGRSDEGVAGYGLVLEEMGKHELITFFVAITPDGHVMDVMILEYRESRGGEVRAKGFLKQYVGKTSQSPLALRKDITPISGATISARAVSDGVKKALAVWEACYDQP